MEMSNSITVINWAGLNYGDNELFDLIISRYIGNNYNKIYVLNDKKNNKVISDKIEFIGRTMGLSKNWIRIIVSILKSDKIFCGGGDIIRGEIGTTLILFLASILKKDLAIVGVGVLEIKSNKKIVRLIKENIHRFIYKNAKILSVRDWKSYNNVKRYAKNVQMNSDLCFLHKLYSDNVNMEKDNIVVVSVIPPNNDYNNTWGEEIYIELAKSLDYLIEKHNMAVIFLCGTLGKQLQDEGLGILGDDIVSKKVINYMKNYENAEIINEIPNFRQAKDILSKSKIYIGFRLHYTITSILSMTPMIAVNYASKIEEVLKCVGLHKYIINTDDFNNINIVKRAEEIIKNYDEHLSLIEVELESLSPELKALDNSLKEFFN